MEKNQDGIKGNTEVETKNMKPKKPISIPEDTLIKVKSGFYGKLYYKNLVTHERFVWEHQNETQIMSLRELRAMKGAQPAFFKNQWVVIAGIADGEDCVASPYDICKALGVTEYYKNFIDPSKFDIVCSWGEAEIADKISMMSPGARENLIIALNELIKKGKLDSIRKIKAFENALGCDFRYFD